MLEIKITIDSALQLLLERMRYELNKRQQTNAALVNFQLAELSFKELKSIVDASIFDTIGMLPLDIILMESNLVSIIGSTVRALAKIFHHEEFLLFSDKNAERLINSLDKCLKPQLKPDQFFRN